MTNHFTPTWTLESVYELTPDQVKHYGFCAVIVDLDNTVVAWNEYAPSERMTEWVTAMRQANVDVYLMSNNTENRVKSVADPLDLPYNASSLKPRRKGFIKLLTQYQLPKDKVLVIGDQVLTDIIGANRMGLKSVLVKPIAQHDNIYTKLNRSIEKFLLKKIGIDRQSHWGNRID